MIKTIGKLRRLIFSLGIGLCGICVLSQTVNAEPIIIGDLKKTDETGYVTYQFTLQETGESLQVNKLYYHDGTDFVELNFQNGLVLWQPDADVQEVLSVVRVADDVTQFKLTNTDETPGETILEVSGTLDTDGITVDNQGPQIEWTYKNITDEKYIEFKATDAATNIYKMLDGTGENGGPGRLRVLIEEKEQAKTVTARYVYQEDEDIFYVYDILGNYTPVDINVVDISYTIAAKNITGEIVVLNMKLQEDAELTGITTVGGVNILTESIKPDTGDQNDYLVGIYTGVPQGTTYVRVNFTYNNVNYSIPVELDLDIDEPIIVQRDIEGTGEIVETGGVRRAYANATWTKAIIEVNDILSGIVKIAVCRGDGNNIQEAKLKNQVFAISHLPKSVLQVLELPIDATYIKVVDGVGNIDYIDLATEVTVVDDTDALSLTLEGDADGVIATFRDTKVGLERFVKATATDAPIKQITEEDGDVSYLPEPEEEDDQEGGANTSGNVNNQPYIVYIPVQQSGNGGEPTIVYVPVQPSDNIGYSNSYLPPNAYETLQTGDVIAQKYPVTTQIVELTGAKIQGTPEFTIIDLFGNQITRSLNDILFHNDYVMMDVNSEETTAIAVKVHDERRIKKITATIDGVEKTLEVFEGGTNADGQGPYDVCKVYDIEKGVVSVVTVYHYNGDVTQNVLTPESGITSVSQLAQDRDDNVVLKENETDEYEVSIVYGIRRLEYSDGCVIDFRDDLPVKLNVHANDGENSLTVVVTDALGYSYTLEHNGADLVTYME